MRGEDVTACAIQGCTEPAAVDLEVEPFTYAALCIEHYRRVRPPYSLAELEPNTVTTDYPAALFEYLTTPTAVVSTPTVHRHPSQPRLDSEKPTDAGPPLP